MNRNDILTLGCGGGGSSLVDDLINYDERYEVFFFNTSQDDMNSLKIVRESDSSEDLYYTISTKNGVGRDRTLGKNLANRKILNMLEIITNYQQKIVNMTTSLGGGSGSSIVGQILKEVDRIREENGHEAIDKLFNLTLILPALNSRSVFLENTLEAWDEILSSKSLNSVTFICNNKRANIADINSTYIELYDSIFNIPINNGREFDAGNLSNILKSKGCTFFFELPSGRTGAEIAFNEAKSSSVLADIFQNAGNTTFVDGEALLDCDYIGASFADSNYNPDDIFKHFNIKRESYKGTNAEGKNILIISGLSAPMSYITAIKKELEKRALAVNNTVDFSEFTVNSTPVENKAATTQEKVASQTKTKLNLFKRRVR